MKKISIISLLLISSFVLSACNNTKQNTVADGGIYKSTDRGENWQQKVTTQTGDTTNNAISGVSTKFMTFDLENNKRIYLSSQGFGIYRTEDGGDKWNVTTLNTGTYIDLTIDSRNTSVIYVTDGSTVKKTVDDMDNWLTVYIEARPQHKINSVKTNFFNPSIIYATTNKDLLKSTDYGNEWKTIKWDSKKNGDISKLYVSHKNQNNIFIQAKNGRIFKSINDGSDWELVYEGIVNETRTDKKIIEKRSLSIKNTIFYPEYEYFFITTDYGIVKSFDGGETWEALNTLVPFNSSAIKYATFDPTDVDNIFFTIKNVLYKSEDRGATWKTIKKIKTARYINYILIDLENSKTLYAGTYKAPK